MARNSKKNSQPVVEVSDLLLDTRIDFGVKQATVLAFADQFGFDFDTSIHFLNGMKTYAEHSEHEYSTGFAFKIEEVEIVDIKVNGDFLLGRKARIHFRDKGYKTDKIVDQYIDTEWVEFNGFNPENQIFAISVANSLYEKAKELEGKKVWIRKHYHEDDNENGFRYLAWISEVHEREDDGDDDRSSRRRGSGGGRRNKSSWEDQLNTVIEGLSRTDRKELTDDDIETLMKLGDSSEKDIKETVADLLEVETKELGDAGNYDNLAEFAVNLFLNSLGE